MRDHGLVRGFLGVVLAGVILSASASAQRQKVLIRGMELDSPEMQDSLSLPYWRALASVPCPKVSWSPSFSKDSLFRKSTAPLMRRLRRDAGSLLLQPGGQEVSRRTIFDGERYRVQRLAIQGRVPNMTSTGLLVEPKGLIGKSAPVVLMHGSGMAPAEAFGWLYADQYGGTFRFDSTAFVGAALELAEAGYTVFVPWFSDDNDNDHWPHVQWRTLARNAAMLSPKSNGLGAYYLLVNQVSGVIDFLAGLPGVDIRKLSAVGWAEGAQIASVAAAFDTRISAVVRLGAPLDRAALRGTVAGVFGEAAFTHVDCALGDVEMAALIAPRPLLYAYSTADASVQRFSGFISPRVTAQVRDLYVRLRRATNFTVQPDVTWSTAQMRRVRTWLDNAVAFDDARVVPDSIPLPRPPASERYRSQYMDSTMSQRLAYIATLGHCVAPVVNPDFSSIEAYAASVEPLRRKLAATLGVPYPARSAPFRITRRDTVLLQPKYTLEYVELTTTRSTIPVTGLLATPITNAGERMPAVISMDANYGMGGLFGLNGPERLRYLNAYGDHLASEGTVVFAPWLPGDFSEVAPPALHAKNPDGPTHWTFTLAVYSAALDFTRSLPQVDSTRVGVWGISYAGFNALYLGALDTRVTTVVYSNPVTTADLFFGEAFAGGLAPWFGEMCAMVDPSMLYLIAPRRFVRENGARDDNGSERRPLESVENVRAIYRRLGIESRFEFYRHSGGHETLPRLLFDN